MTTLERTCRLLLRVYPAEYRRDRGEEIIGTLLEATPPSRCWPLARDVGALVLAGLHARAALNRRRTTAANLRFAVAMGAAAYLALIAASDLTWGAFVPMQAGQAREHDWLTLLGGALVLAALVLAWVSSRRIVVLAGTISAAVAVTLPPAFAGVLGSSALAWPIPELVCLAAMAVPAVRGERPGWRWALPVALVSIVPALDFVPGMWTISVSLHPLVAAIGVISLLWALTDARPAVAAAVFLLVLWLPVSIRNFVGYPDFAAVVPVLIVIAATAVLVWRLHRQSARIPRPES